MKIAVLIVLGSLPYLDKVGDFLIGWTQGNNALQIIFVMFVSSPFTTAFLDFLQQRLI